MLKKLLLGLIYFFITSTIVNAASCYELSNSYKYYSTESTRFFDLYLATSYKDTELRNEYLTRYNQYKTLSSTTYSEYLDCKVRISGIFDKGYDATALGRYSDSITYFESYLIENGDTSDGNYIIARNNLALSYKKYADSFYMKDNFREAVNYYLKALLIDPKLQSANYFIAESYFALNELNNAKDYAQTSYNNATSSSDITSAKSLIDRIEAKLNLQNAQLNAPSNDTYSFLQYYIKDLNIHTAWTQVINPKQVIVAIIDDGININHPDLIKNIWIRSGSEYGASKIINFVGDNIPDNLPTGPHGTMVGGIIGATINNNEGIAGIAKNVKLMPLRVFDANQKGKPDSIIRAINYAIDNGANIINLSLGGNQFKYNKEMDEVIKKAYDSGIFVVIAGGNGDDLSDGQEGVFLDNNPISPVCNNSGKNYSFGVFATDRDGYRTNWTNYGNCTRFGSPGVEIFSSSLTISSKLNVSYDYDDGTSFSAPIVSGILALGYNKFGKVPYSVAYDALVRATTNNSKGNPVLDANKYLNNLQSYFDNQNAKKLDGLKKKAQLQFDRYNKQYSNLSTSNKISKYKLQLASLEKKKKILRGDNLLVNNLIIDLINMEISRL